MKEIREIVKEIVLEAGGYIRGELGMAKTIDFKGDIDLVTDVDRKSEEMITRVIEDAFPGDDLLAEERGPAQERKSSRCWLIDPLDGTTNFAHGYPFVAISIALESEGDIVFGVVYDPVMNEYFEAEKGAGATRNGTPIHVSDIGEVNRSLFATGFPYDIKEHPEGHLERLGRILMAGQGIRRDGSAALDLCYVASGRLDAFYEKNLAPWDTAAGKLMVEEAGGKVTTFSGEAFSVYGREITATNGLLHDEVVAILNEGDSGAPKSRAGG